MSALFWLGTLLLIFMGLGAWLIKPRLWGALVGALFCVVMLGTIVFCIFA